MFLGAFWHGEEVVVEGVVGGVFRGVWACRRPLTGKAGSLGHWPKITAFTFYLYVLSIS